MMSEDIELGNGDIIKLSIPLLAYLNNRNKNTIPPSHGFTFLIFGYHSQPRTGILHGKF